MTPTFATLALAVQDNIATVSLNRPDKANAMNAAMWTELQQCFEWLDDEPSVRVVIFAHKQALLQGVTAIAAEIAKKSPLAVRGTKEILLYSRDHSVSEGLNYIATWNSGMLSQTDISAALAAQINSEAAVFED
jgi:enoyl-CoA hydratase/carnithine racemase